MCVQVTVVYASDFLFCLMFSLQIVEGEGEAVLTTAMLQSKFRNLNELIGHSLYVSVTVMTDSGK